MVLDIHAHYMAFSECNGGYINPRFARGIRPRLYLYSVGVLSRQEAMYGTLPAPEELDRRLHDRLVAMIDASELSHAVMLAFDGVYGADGRLDYRRTVKYMSNDAVAAFCKRSPKLLLAGSVNPFRPDALEELERCVELGAVEIKWLPSVMGIDPGSRTALIFCERAKTLKKPILCHIGFEFALPNIDTRFNGLDRLERMLETGVTVIAAHCCGGRPLIDDERSFDELRRLVETYPSLYLDVSGMASIHRRSRLLRAIEDPTISARLLYGSDFPVPLHPWAFAKELGIARCTKLPQNYFDRDIAIKRGCKLDEAAMTRGYAVIGKQVPGQA